MSKKNGKGGSRTVFRPTDEWRAQRHKERKFEWVELDDGGSICVWANRVHEGLAIMAGSTRPPEFGGNGEPDETAAMTWSVQVACHTGEPPDAELTFPVDKLWAIQELSSGEFNRIWDAIKKVNGMDRADTRRLEAFTTRTREEPSAP